MKKIIAILLALTCVVALASCGTNDVDRVGAMFEASKPTKTVITTTQSFGETILTGEYVLTTGYVDGKIATVYTAEYQELLSVEEGGASDVIQGDVITRTEKKEYLEGKGVRENGGAWDKNGENFALETGPVSLNLSSEYIKTFTYENNLLRCAVAAANTAEVLGLAEDLASDVSIEVKDDGASVTVVTISYVIAADADTGVEETNVSIKAEYHYDLEKITID